MDENDRRLDELLRRAAGKPKTDAEAEEKLLDFMEFMIKKGTSCDPKTMATRRGKWLVRQGPSRVWAEWFVLADRNPEAWDAVMVLIAELRKSDCSWLLCVPPLLDWVLDVALGIRSRPSKRGRKPDEYLFRNSVIAVTIGEIRALDHRPVYDESGRSICDVVAARIGLSPHSVKGIWRARPRGALERPSDV